MMENIGHRQQYLETVTSNKRLGQSSTSFALPCPMLNKSFTAQGHAPPVICQRCLQSFEAVAELFYMQNNKVDARGKKVCSGCHQYYLKKTETCKSLITYCTSALLSDTSVVQAWLSLKTLALAWLSTAQAFQNEA